MKTVLLINGKETGEFSQGRFNTGLADVARETLKDHYEIIETVIEDGYDAAEEIAKFKKADVVIYQYPVFWFTFPSTMKKYLDTIYAYDEFFTFNDGPYGSGGLMKGKKVLFSTTWNAPADEFGNENGYFKGQTLDDVLLPISGTHDYCGFDVLPAFGAHNVVADPQFDQDAARFKAHLTKLLLENDSQAA